jgi:hypothetical protein
LSSDRDNPAKFHYRPNANVYEINTWPWLDELSRREGRPVTLGTVPESDWDRLHALGFDFVWLMGVWQRSAKGRHIAQTLPELFPGYEFALPGWRVEQVVGSPYSIANYIPDSHLASWDELDHVRAQLHSRGMGLVVDLVPNHTAFDHPWVDSHPEYYVQGSLDEFKRNPSAYYLIEHAGSARFIARGRDPNWAPWTDVAQLNYSNPELRLAMIDQIRQIAAHADGVRADMTMLVLNEVFERTWGALAGKPPEQEFWDAAISSVPNLVWIAEAYWDLEAVLHRLGFDFVYGKRWYDALREGWSENVRRQFAPPLDYQRRLVRFLENHDEDRALSAFGEAKMEAVATLLATAPGMRLYHHGQLEGKRVRQPVQLGASRVEPPVPAVTKVYERLFQIADASVFHRGSWRLLEVKSFGDEGFRDLIAYCWTWGTDVRVVVVNLNANPARAVVEWPGSLDGDHLRVTDQIHRTNTAVSAEEMSSRGLHLSLPGYGAQILTVTSG